MTQRLVPGAGRSAIVSGLPSGPITYLTLGRWGSVIDIRSQSPLLLTNSGRHYGPRLKIWLSGPDNWVKIAASFDTAARCTSAALFARLSSKSGTKRPPVQ